MKLKVTFLIIALNLATGADAKSGFLALVNPLNLSPQQHVPESLRECTNFRGDWQVRECLISFSDGTTETHTEGQPLIIKESDCFSLTTGYRTHYYGTQYSEQTRVYNFRIRFGLSQDGKVAHYDGGQEMLRVPHMPTSYRQEYRTTLSLEGQILRTKGYFFYHNTDHQTETETEKAGTVSCTYSKAEAR